MGISRWAIAAVLLQLGTHALVHGHDDGHGMDMERPKAPHNSDGEVDPYDMPSYAGLDQHHGAILAHIVLMMLAWVVILPLGR